MQNNDRSKYNIIADKLAEYASITPFGSVSVELTMDKGTIAKVKFSNEIRKLQFMDLENFENKQY